MSNELEMVSIKLEDVTSKNIEKCTEYQIYEKRNNDGVMYTVWGENRLVLTDKEISFTIREHIPFKYHRGLLGLEHKTKLYLQMFEDNFKEDNTLTFNSSSEDDDSHMVYNIDVTSTDTDIDKFMCKILGFEFLFEEKLKLINEKISKIL